MDAGHVTADGSPVAVYLAAAAGDAPSLIHQALKPGATILELGAGAGRVTRVLVAYGHRVVAVDDDPAMLEHVTGAEVVCADLFHLDLGRRFDAVVAGSHLVDDADLDRRRRLLAVCARHVARPGGRVLVERYRPEWAQDPTDASAWLGPVEIDLSIRERNRDHFKATVSYRLGDRRWQQDFAAGPVDDEQLQRLGAAVGLSVSSWLDADRTWACLTPVPVEE